MKPSNVLASHGPEVQSSTLRILFPGEPLYQGGSPIAVSANPESEGAFFWTADSEDLTPAEGKGGHAFMFSPAVTTSGEMASIKPRRSPATYDRGIPIAIRSIPVDSPSAYRGRAMARSSTLITRLGPNGICRCAQAAWHQATPMRAIHRAWKSATDALPARWRPVMRFLNSLLYEAARVDDFSAAEPFAARDLLMEKRL